VRRLITINTPIYFWNIPMIVKNCFNAIKSKNRENIKRYLCAANQAAMSSLIQFLIILHKSKPMFKNIHCDTLVLQCKDDDTVWPSSAEYIKRAIPAAEVIYYNSGGHVVLLSKTKDSVCNDVLSFIKER
jgi:carboxylesterase